MASNEPSFTHDGSDVIVSSEITVQLMDYQCVTSHGVEAVSDAGNPTNVTYSPGKAVLKYVSPSKAHGRVHVPVHNPPEVVDKKLALNNIIVSFAAQGGAIVDMVTLYYDSAMIVSTDTKKTKTFNVQFTQNERNRYAYTVKSGISVMLDLNFPNAGSFIELYSITLVYQAIDTIPFHSFQT